LGAAGLAAAPFDGVLCACAKLDAPHTSKPVIAMVSIRRTVIAKSAPSIL
jgi:hypothetical protein